MNPCISGSFIRSNVHYDRSVRNSAFQGSAVVRRKANGSRWHPLHIAIGIRVSWLLALAQSPSNQTEILSPPFLPSKYLAVPLSELAGTAPGFTRLETEKTGLAFTNHLAESTIAHHRILENGSGIALGDFDGDGWCDIYLCGLENNNVLYRNLGNWTFEDVTVQAGLECAGQHSTGAVFADVNGNGHLDLLVNGIGAGTRLFLNDGSGKFHESFEGRLTRRFGATSMALADLNGDGWLDLYVTNYRTDTYKDRPPGLKVEAVRERDGSIRIQPPDRFLPLQPRGGAMEVFELGERDFLYLNQGQGRFAPVSWTAGGFVDVSGQPLKEPPLDWGLAVQFRDLNGDGLPDLYVCNDFAASRDRIWINENSQRLRAAPTFMFRNQSLSSMAVDMADLDRDGHMDLFIGDMLSRRLDWRAWQRPNTLAGLVVSPKHLPEFEPEVTRNTLHRAWGDGTFAEIACFAGLAATDWTWSVAFLDVDLDGWEDLLVANGNAHDVQDADVLEELSRVRESRSTADRVRNLQKFGPLKTPNLAFRNQRNLTFADVSATWGFDEAGVTTGMALADLDNDGDLDVVLNNLNGPARLYRNNSPAPRIAVRLRGRPHNTEGIGAKIRVLGGPVDQMQEMISSGRYCSGDQALRVFAAGSLSAKLRIEVTWRSGTTSVVTEVRPNHLYIIEEPDVSGQHTLSSKLVPTPLPESTSEKLLFIPWTGLEDARHQDESFDDMSRQPLLPKRLSTEGPGLTWWEFPGNGMNILILPSGTGHALRYWYQTESGTFDPRPQMGWASTGNRSQQTALPVRLPDDQSPTSSAKEDSQAFVLGTSTWRLEPGPHSPGDLVSIPNKTHSPLVQPIPLPALPQGGIPLAVADLTGDGVGELFVGGRATPGRWPESGPSSILRYTSNGWQVHQSFPGLERVTGAVFTDLNQDGWPDLAVACEWGPVRIYLNQQGQLVEVTEEWGMGSTVGLWTCITSGDFNNDGLPDLLVGNWGQNFRTDTSNLNEPLHLVWHADVHLGTHALIAGMDVSRNLLVPWREWRSVSSVLPGVADRFPTHRAYASASAQDLFQDLDGGTRSIRATQFMSTVFLNQGTRLHPIPLPAPAQWSPAMGVAVGDFDGDGFEDVILSQNYFGTDAETARQDAGLGLVLLGTGEGTFTPMPPHLSGIRVPGEGRGVAIGDLNKDGRPDVAIAQYNGPLHVYLNENGQQGWRLRADPPIPGTAVRLYSGGRGGYRKELRIGEGAGSVSAPVLFFGSEHGAVPDEVEVRFPGKATERYPWTGNAREGVIQLGVGIREK